MYLNSDVITTKSKENGDTVLNIQLHHSNYWNTKDVTKQEERLIM